MPLASAATGLASRCAVRNGMDPADFRHERSAQTCRPHASNAHGRDQRRAVAAMGDLLRHPALRRIADLPARSHGPRVAQPRRIRGKHALAPRPLRGREDHPHFRHALPLAQGPDERRGPADRPRLCQAVWRNRRRRSIAGPARALSARAHRARLRLDRGWRRLRGRRRKERFSRFLARGRPGRSDEGRRRLAACAVRPLRPALCSARRRRRSPTRTASSTPATWSSGVGDRLYFVGRRGGVINVGGAKVHPEEVEAALNAHAAVLASRVFARKSPITGALVFAEVVLREADAAKSGAPNAISSPRAASGWLDTWFRQDCASSPICR